MSKEASVEEELKVRGNHMSHILRKWSYGNMRTAKTQVNPRIREFCSKSL